jgi:hypothetical protein
MEKTRHPHFISRTYSRELPNNILFFDTETLPEETNDNAQLHKLKLGVAQYYRRKQDGQYRLVSEIVFSTSDEFVSYVESILRSKITLYLISHNLMFDFLASQVFVSFPAAGIELKSFYNKGFTSIFKYEYNGAKITALDFGNFMSTSLEKIGKLVNMPKMDIDFNNTTDEYLTEYCRNDVLVMVKALGLWIEFLQTNNLGSFRSTIASTAFNIMRYRFMPHKIYIHNDKQALELEDNAYHGGRVEANRVGFFNTDTYYKLDIHSMYPYICSVNKFPVSLYRVIDQPGLDTLQDKLGDYAVIADVLLQTDENAYPLLHNSKLLYPVGNFRTTLSTPELIYAMENNHIQEVYRLSVYQKQPIFSDYMQYFYNLRVAYKSEDNEVFDKICKMLMNSLYGKFGQRGLKQEIIGDNKYKETKIHSGYDSTTNAQITQYWLGNKVYQTIQTGYSYNAFPAIASHVTSYARMYLYRLKKAAGIDNVYYNDTDSLFTNEAGYVGLKSYIHPDRLGALGIEEVCDWLEVMCPKNYRTPQTDKHKGVRSSAIEFSENTFAQDQFSGLNGMLRKGIPDGIMVKLIEKHLSMRITHGYPPDLAGFVRPFVFRHVHGSNVPLAPLVQPSVTDWQSEKIARSAFLKEFFRQA